MANYTAYHGSQPGLDIYAKQLPLNTSNWATGVVVLNEVASTGVYSGTLVSANQYMVFVQEGGSPSATDPIDGSFASNIWDTVLTGATHNVPASAGRRLRQLADTVVLDDGQNTGASNGGPDGTGTITLKVGTTTACIGQSIRSNGQVRFIESYDVSTRVAILDQPWCVVPGTGDDYTIYSQRSSMVGKLATALADTYGFALKNLQSLLENVSGWRFTAKALEVGVQNAVGSLTGAAIIPPVVPEKQTVFLYQGDTYDGIARPLLTWEIDKDLQGWSGKITIRHRVTDLVLLEANATAPSPTQIVVTLTAVDTAFTDLVDPKEFGPHPFDIEFTLGSSVLTPVDGVAVITRQKTEPTP
jgi:hypothetical protein